MAIDEIVSVFYPSLACVMLLEDIRVWVAHVCVALMSFSVHEINSYLCMNVYESGVCNTVIFIFMFDLECSWQTTPDEVWIS